MLTPPHTPPHPPLASLAPQVTNKPSLEYAASDASGAVSFFEYKGKSIMMQRSRGQTLVVGDDRQPMEMEDLTLTCWGTDSTIIKDLLSEALDASAKKADGSLDVWVLGRKSWLGGWTKVLTKQARSLDSVILDADLSDRAIVDAHTFMKSASWYSENGIPFRRGYLLHGPPGSGKTSFCQVLASELKLALCMLTLADENLTDSALAEALRDAPRDAIILLEDVDSIFIERQRQGDVKGGVTFSGLLNALDGVASQEGRITIMTTNHVERLDAALIRPGRCDVRLELKNASTEQAGRMFRRFFPNAPPGDAELFKSLLPNNEVSMATLQGHFLCHRDDAAKAIDAVPALLGKKGDGSSSDDNNTDDNGRSSYSAGGTPLHTHLRRVGLERYAYAFEENGYFTKKDFESLGSKPDVVKGWIAELKYDLSAADRMSKLMSRDQELMKEYVVADTCVIRELWRAAFDNDEDSSRAVAKFSALVAPSGRSSISIWQLKWHLEVHRRQSAASALAFAPSLVAPRCTASSVVADDRGARHMTTYEWCRRAGNEAFTACAFALEDSGHKLARDFMHITEVEKLKEIGFDSNSAKLAKVILECKFDAGQSHILHSFKALDFEYCVREFEMNFPGVSAGLAVDFALAVTSPTGFGLASLSAIRVHLTSCGTDAALAARTARERLLDYRAAKAERPAPIKKEPTWLETRLKAEGVEDMHALAFTKENFVSKNDILSSEPEITELQLEKVFRVEKLGDRLKILRVIKKLKEAEIWQKASEGGRDILAGGGSSGVSSSEEEEGSGGD